MLAHNKLAVYCFVLILITVISFFFPLFNVFGYEFSVLTAVILSLVSGIFVISSLRKSDLKNEESRRTFFKRIKLSAFYFILTPLLLALVHSFIGFSCSLYDGILFYLVITVPGFLTGAALGIFSYSLSKRFGIFIFLVIFLLILSIAGFEFYYYPQVYFYNALFGFYPGTIYDEALSVTWKLTGYRLFNTLFFSGLFLISLSAVYKSSKKIILSAVSYFIIIAGIFYFIISPVLGYTTSFGRLDSELRGEAVTPHFIIHYPASLEPRLVKVIAAEHEYYYIELSKFFGYGMDRKINSYVFKDRTQKAGLFGSANADVAKIWQLSVYTTYNDYNSILKHELAHCFSSKIGTGIFKAASGLNPALIEGIAVAADPEYDSHSIKYMARLAYANGYKADIPRLFSGFNFFGQTSSISYIYAGAFSGYLIKNYGMKKFSEFYGNGNFGSAYGFGIREAASKFDGYLDSSKVIDRKAQANYYFGRGTIFTKICPRFVSDRVDKGWKLFNSGDYHSAGKLFAEVLAKTENYSALTGYSECLIKTGRIKDAARLLREKISSFKNTAYYYNIELRLGDALSRLKDVAGADSLYSELVKQNPSPVLYDLAALRLDLSKNDSLLFAYTSGSDFDKYLILKKINKETYNYYSLPAMVNLSDALNENYGEFIGQFSRPFEIRNLPSAYALLKLSVYMARNLDFCNAAETARLSAAFKAGNSIEVTAERNYNKLKWLCSNFNRILSKTKIITN